MFKTIFEHSLFALFLLAFATVIFIPSLVIGSIGAYRLRITRQQQYIYTSTTCFVSNMSDVTLSYDCNCDGCHPSTCYAEHFDVQYQIENGTKISSIIDIDQIPGLLQIQINNNYTCFYDRTDATKVQWLMPSERPALAMLIVGFGISVGTYIVEYDYIAKSSDELTIRKGDIITDAIPAEQGWLKGECRGTFGHFPENFVTPLTKEKAKNRTFANELGARLQSAVNGNNVGNKSGTLRKRPTNDDTLFQSQQSNNLPNGTLFQVKVAYIYTPVHEDELSINPNDIINVTRMVEEGWYEGTLNGKLGLFPSNYVTRITDETNHKKDPPIKRKPVNGLSALVNKEVNKSVSPTSIDTPQSQQKTPPTPPLSASKKSTPVKARVLFDYKKAADDELTLTVNDIVTILDKHLEDEGWWKGELHGRVGVFPDNYVEEIPASSINTKHRPNTPEAGAKNLSQTLPKTKITNGDSSHDFSNNSHHTKPTSISDEEGYSSRNHYAEINNLDAVGITEKLSGFNKPKPLSAKRPPSSTIRKNENGLSKTTGSLDETNHNNRPQFNDIKNENKVHTPSPPSSQREPGQLESPRYTNRPSSLHSALMNNNNNHHTNSSLNGTTDLSQTATNSSYINGNMYNSSTITIEQLHKDYMKMKVSMDEMKIKFADQIRDLVGELDEEKKARATLQIELERLQKQIHKSALVN
ncbi:unnamed protein product [Adineta steineri]|uniref:SH3 domain-containing protein n=1 Tax=Adineta steineri TaxID=433720 RepID=A0A818JPG5_9BILA|nr:unnamed protein product [Adineta steineri]